MAQQLSRRGFVKSSLVAAAAAPFGLHGQANPTAETPTPTGTAAAGPREKMPTGKIGGQEFSRLMLGGNLIGGWSHSRDLAYVGTLMRRYNTDAKIRETLELAEAHGITAINTWVMQENSHLFNHWKRGGKMKWIAQVRLDADGGYSQIHKAIDEGAAGVHITGDTAESLLSQEKFEKVGETVQLIKSKKRIAGVAAHDLRVIVECEKAKVDADFYQKTFHSLDYYTAPRPDEKDALGAHDNSWCNDPQAVIDVMARATKPWIAFKVLAAGAIQPEVGFRFAFENGADHICVGMFDFQVVEDVNIVNEVLASIINRERAWHT